MDADFKVSLNELQWNNIRPKGEKFLNYSNFEKYVFNNRLQAIL